MTEDGVGPIPESILVHLSVAVGCLPVTPIHLWTLSLTRSSLLHPKVLVPPPP